ncbi:hypothetical protein PBRA_008168 [Plasmodiophora brassicae]|uniref:Uncharacterized protein n=1 Tax=Plasmodiophora brassicae TaxID=37360 RepID=A0A0G4J0M7_PLABS|nr:hypothetical protein PBRA_008168 [Plasmodiophora brassicae]
MSSSSLADAGRDGGGVVVPPLPPELWEMIATHVAADDLRSRMALASVSRGMFDGPSGRRIRYESILHQVFPGGDAAGKLTGAGVVAQLDVFMRDFADRGLTRAVHLKHLAERIPAVIHFHSVYAVLDAILPLATSRAALLDRLDRLIEAPTPEFLLRALAEVCLTRRTRQCLDLLRARCAATNSTLKVPSPTTTTEDVDAAVAHLRLALDEQDFAYLPAEYVGDTHGDALPCNVMHLMMQGVPAGLLVDDAATTMQEGGARLPDRVLSGPLYFYMSAAAHGSPLRHFQSSLAGIALDLDHPVSFLDGVRDVSLLVPDEQDLTPVKRAVFRDQVGVVDDLARMDARVLHDPTGEPAFLFAVRCARWPSVALIAALVNPESPSSAWQMRSAMPKWRNALLTACSAGVVDLFDHVSFDGERRQTDWVVPDALLLSVDAGNHTCLHLAVYSGWRYREQVVPVALDRVEDVVRALCDRAVALRLLVPFVSVRTNNGRTALMGAIAAGLNSVIGILFDYLERHASPDDIWALLSVQDRHNRSALHFAVDEQNARAFDLVVACLQRQAPARVPHLLALRNHENRTALDLMPADDPVWASVRANLSIATSSSSSLLAAARLRRRALGADVADHNHNLSEKLYL